MNSGGGVTWWPPISATISGSGIGRPPGAGLVGAKLGTVGSGMLIPPFRLLPLSFLPFFLNVCGALPLGEGTMLGTVGSGIVMAEPPLGVLPTMFGTVGSGIVIVEPPAGVIPVALPGGGTISGTVGSGIPMVDVAGVRDPAVVPLVGGRTIFGIVGSGIPIPLVAGVLVPALERVGGRTIFGTLGSGIPIALPAAGVRLPSVDAGV